MQTISGSSVIPHLSPERPSTELALRNVTIVPIDPDLLVVDCAAVEKVYGTGCLFSGCEFYETEPTRLVCLPVKSHVEVDQLAALREKSCELTFLGGEGEISNVDGARGTESFFVLVFGETTASVEVF